jgi:citrate synthase
VALLQAIARRLDEAGASDGAAVKAAVAAEMTALAAAGVTHVPGFGHRFHPVDPRAPRLLELVDQATAAGAVSGRFAVIGRAVEADWRRASAARSR